MLTLSDNASANALETWIGGSTSGGSALVNATMRSIGLRDTEMYGGYVLGTVARRRQGARRARDPADGRRPAVVGRGQADDRL